MLFIPIYGELNIWSKKQGQFGKIRLGNTAGEEAICDKQFQIRADNCFAESESALIGIMKDRWFDLKNSQKGDIQLHRDIIALEDMLRKNYFVKKRWRTGIINSTRS